MATKKPTPRVPLNLSDAALLGGGAAWILAVFMAFRRDDPGFATVLLPLWKPIGSLAGNGPNIGTLEHPGYEATPIHIILSFIGIGASAGVYILIAAAVVWAWRNRRVQG